MALAIVALQFRPPLNSRKSRRFLAPFARSEKPHSLWDGKAAGANRFFKATAALPPDDFRRLDFKGKIPHFLINAPV